MEKYFYLDESPVYKEKYLIRLNIDKLPFPHGTSGSYNVLFARVLNLSYAEALRYCRDRLGAELIGKNRRYVAPFFDKTPEVQMFVRLLNTRMNYIMNEQRFPYELKEVNEGNVELTPFHTINEDNFRLT